RRAAAAAARPVRQPARPTPPGGARADAGGERRAGPGGARGPLVAGRGRDPRRPLRRAAARRPPPDGRAAARVPAGAAGLPRRGRAVSYPRRTVVVAGTMPVRLSVIDVGPSDPAAPGAEPMICIHGAGGDAMQ